MTKEAGVRSASEKVTRLTYQFCGRTGGGAGAGGAGVTTPGLSEEPGGSPKGLLGVPTTPGDVVSGVGSWVLIGGGGKPGGLTGFGVGRRTATGIWMPSSSPGAPVKSVS